MLPDIRQSDSQYPVPEFNLGQGEIDDFLDELKGFHEQFADCFQRSESRDHFFRYMAGQFSELERKSIEPIAFAVEGGQVRAMQRFVSDAPWDEEKIMDKYRNMVKEDLGDPSSAIVFDESGFVKKGKDSVGVSKQYCGTIGKVDNCQVGVFASYVSPHGYALIDKRLYVPKEWFSPEYEQRRGKCKLPENVEFKTKPQLAVDMLQDVAEQGVLPFRYILADSVYGNSPEFIEAADSLIDVTYMVQVPENTLCWLKQPVLIKKSYSYRGKKKKRKILSDESSKPFSFKDIAESLHNTFWYRRKVSEGTKGPIEYEFTKRRVVLARDGLPEKTVWLLIRRSIGDEPRYSYYISNAPCSVRLNTLVWLSGLRWAIEQCFEECKTELGMDQYEVRKFPGWHHHILTCMLGHFFLWHTKVRLGKKSTSYYALAA
jgi:SRSO17 transposase